MAGSDIEDPAPSQFGPSGASPGGNSSESSTARPADSEVLRLREQLAPELEIVRLIGRGQMASVFLARDVALRRPVAVKTLRAELAADAIARARFEREAQSAAGIAHPNVVAIHRIARLDDGSPYIVMEFVDGRDLAATLAAEGPIDVSSARRILVQLAEALAAAHAHAIIHRDVRPANILLERGSGRVVLTDFGLAAVAISGAPAVTRITREGETIGDPRYMSPEQLTRQPLSVESDVYSLGLIGYEILTCAQPYRTEGLADPITARLRTAPRKLSDLLPGAPLDLETVLVRCLALQPEGRPRTSEIGRLLSGRSTSEGSGGRHEERRGLLQDFLAELWRRRVLGEAIAYLGIAFAILQGADIALRALGTPELVFRVLVFVVLAGFPVFLVFAWAFDIRRGHAVVTDAADGTPGKRAIRLTMQILGIVLSVVAVIALGWWFLR